MSTFLLKFEAIESRIASVTCPRGTAGRVHSLRLRRFFQHNARRQSTSAPKLSSNFDRDDRFEQPPIYAQEDGFAVDRKLAADAEVVGDATRRGGHDSAAPESSWKSRSSRSWDPYKPRRRFQVLRPQGDVLPFDLADGLPPDASPDTVAFYTSLRLGDPHAVLSSLLDQIKAIGIYNLSRDFFAKIPATTFSEILRCIDPKHFLNRYQTLHREIGKDMVTLLGIPKSNVDGYHTFCDLLLSQIQAVIKERQYVSPLSLFDYKYLLKCARATGNVSAADAIWRTLQQPQRARGLLPSSPAPDVECYNHYLATKCWADTVNLHLRQRLRIVPDNIEPRMWRVPHHELPYTLNGHRIGPAHGIKVEVSGLFREMVESGLRGSEETFTHMMVALARSGDIAGMEAIFKRVWGIDVAAVLSLDESDIPPPKHYPRDSPFYPSQQLLYTLAHAYGINNSIPTALRIIDYVSRQYTVPIPFKVWNHLLEWTFVVSMKRSKKSVEAGHEAGKLPEEAVLNLWNTMTGEPYSIQPTMEMYSRLIVNLIRRQCFGKAQIYMEEARFLHKRSVLDLSHAITLYKCSPAQDQNSISSIYEKRARDLAFAHLRVRRNRQYLRKWVRMLLSHGNRKLASSGTWTSQNLPKITQHWQTFLPRLIKYETDTGFVRYNSGSRIENLQRQLRYGRHQSQSRDKQMQRLVV